jgi:hypothetical protein
MLLLDVSNRNIFIESHTPKGRVCNTEVCCIHNYSWAALQNHYNINNNAGEYKLESYMSYTRWSFSYIMFSLLISVFLLYIYTTTRARLINDALSGPANHRAYKGSEAGISSSNAVNKAVFKSSTNHMAYASRPSYPCHHVINVLSDPFPVLYWLSIYPKVL